MTATEERALVVAPVDVTVLPARTVFGTDDPQAIVDRVESIAQALGKFIRAHGMSRRLESDSARQRREREGRAAPREYVFIEGWSFLGQMLGIAPVTREVRELRDAEGTLVGFEARVELVRADGTVVGGAVGECSWAEPQWANREPFAVKSMAQNRAAGKAFRLSYGFVMGASGFEVTPAEEMPDDEAHPPASSQPPQEARSGPVASGVAAGADSGRKNAPRPPVGRQEPFPNKGALYTWAYREHGLSKSQLDELTGVAAAVAAGDLEAARQAVIAAIGSPS